MTRKHLATGKANSIGTSALNAISALQEHARQALVDGDQQTAHELRLEANAIAAETGTLYLVREKIRSEEPLMPFVNALTSISADAKAAVRRMETVAKVLKAATRILKAMERLKGLI
jgi:hypothetical protein